MFFFINHPCYGLVKGIHHSAMSAPKINFSHTRGEADQVAGTFAKHGLSQIGLLRI